MTENKEISVIIPVYNGEGFLKHTVESIISKNVDVDYEVVLVDDGSTDNSPEIIVELENNNPEVIITMFKKNGGIASARNTGLHLSSGKYITFFDQDDMCINSYRSFLDQMEEQKADMLISDYYINEDSKTIKKNRVEEKIVLEGEEKNDLVRELIGGGNIPLIIGKYRHPPESVWNCIISRYLIFENGLSFKKIVDFEDDWIFQIECILKSRKIYLCNNAYYCWRINQKSESHINKYIPDFFDRRLALLEWIHEKLYEVGTNDTDIQLFDNILIFRTLIWSLYNETWNECASERVEHLKKAVTYFSPEQYNNICKNVKISNADRILFHHLKKREIKRALFLNKWFMKKHYH